MPLSNAEGVYMSNNHVSDEQVRARALELWEQRGRPTGYDDEFWLQAERELKGEGGSIARSGSSAEIPITAPEPSAKRFRHGATTS